MTLAERFWTKVHTTSGCWLWTASRRSNGCGHEFTSENTYVHSRGHRKCRTCVRQCRERARTKGGSK